MQMVSIIIPVHNGEGYLNYNFQSILQQTCKSLQVIYMDDGSTDRSLEMLEEFTASGSFPVIALHQDNQGTAAARNNALRHAAGEYVMFVDQDDVIEADYVERLLETAQKESADIVVSGYMRGKPGERPGRIVSLKEESWSKFMNVAPWGKIYRRKFIKENGLHFLNVAKGEDCYFTVMAYAVSGKTKIIPYVGYHWIINKASVTNTAYRGIRPDTSIGILLRRLYEDLPAVNRNITQTELEFYFIKSIVYDLLFSCRGVKKEEINFLHSELMKWIKEVCPDYMENEYISLIRPEAEPVMTRFAVCCFMAIHRLGMDLKFLYLYNKIVTKRSKAVQRQEKKGGTEETNEGFKGYLGHQG